jgi:hypothetical protein
MEKRIKLPEVSCTRGAPMGRHSDRLEGKVRLQAMRMVDGAYDQGGAYWGCGDTMYVAQDGEGNLAFYRAKNRADAKAKVQADSMNDNISFYR